MPYLQNLQIDIYAHQVGRQRRRLLDFVSPTAHLGLCEVLGSFAASEHLCSS